MASIRYLILGGGMVAGYAAKELVERGLKPGELTIISSDTALPYERPPLSKSYLAGKDTETSVLINGAEFYRDHGIEIKLRTQVISLDTTSKRLTTSAGEELAFDKLLISTGARARTFDLPGSNLSNVFYLRSLDDSRNIRAKAAGAKQAAVIGGGFIGMEVSAVLAQKNTNVTMIVQEDRVWGRVFTPEMSGFFERYYTERGVRIVKQARVQAFEGDDGNIGSLVLAGGEKIPCDLAIAGIGALPNTEMLISSGIEIDNGVVVNDCLEASQRDVYAAGDVANYPDAIFGKRRRVEHWDNAVSQGQHWARVVLGERQPFVHVPYFFSDVFDLSYELWGDSSGSTEAVIRGDINTSSFSVWWMKQGQLIAAFAMNRPDEERESAPKWIETHQKLSVDLLRDSNRSIHDAAL